MNNWNDGSEKYNLRAKIEKLEQDNADYEKSFELRHSADMRAIARWRGKNPGKELVMPDHADLCIWLLGQNEKLRAALESLRAQPLDQEPGHWGIKCIEDFNAIIEEALNLPLDSIPKP